MGVTRTEVAELVKKNIFVQLDKGKWNDEVEAEMLATVTALRKAMREHPITHAVSFHTSIARAKAFKENQDIFTASFPEYGVLETFHVAGRMPMTVRSNVMENFAASWRGLVTNARCLTEGIDVPDIDCVVFADPKGSKIDIVQAVGRALRPSTGKKKAYVLVPILVDRELSPNESADAGAFDHVLSVLRALAAHDERIIEELRSISQGRSRVPRGRIVNFVMPEGVEIDVDDFVNSIEVYVWSRLARLNWLPFEKAREFARGLRLNGFKEWDLFVKGELPEKGTLPPDIPASPEDVYKNSGWVSWGDWLGTRTVWWGHREWRPFKEARKFVHALGLSGTTEWNRYRNGELPGFSPLPEDIPKAPWQAYKDEGWVSMGDWLGTGAVQWQLLKRRPFKQARSFARSLGLKSVKEWRKYCKGELKGMKKNPDDIPANPHVTYKDKGWINWGDWLGTGTIATRQRKYRPFREARKFSRSLGLRNITEWKKYSTGKMRRSKGLRPDDIPGAPDYTYKRKGWAGWGDWLGTARKRKTEDK
jgi:hypothetical protein